MAQSDMAEDNVEMADAGEAQNGVANGSSTELAKSTEEQSDSAAMPPPDSQPRRVPYSIYLKSRIVEITVGQPDMDHGGLNAHQDLLIQSPYFAERISNLGPGDLSKINLTEEDPATIESFLEYLYTKEYFPRLVVESGRKRLEAADDDIPSLDDTGAHLLRHAKVYSVAKKFGVDELCKLAFTKIHLVDSSPSAEIAYARYVYESSRSEDSTIRDPVKGYWASVGQDVRSEVASEFKQMCLDFPEFGFDVLTMVFNQNEKPRAAHSTSGHGSARKRMRSSEALRG